MHRSSLVAGLIVYSLSTYCSSQPLAGRLFSPDDPPSGCQIISGLFPVGAKTELIWDYRRYAVVMPPVTKKLAQSLQCGSQKGTLYFFDYATETEKEHALLFAKPVLDKQPGISHELPIREWSTGFVLVSFVDTPPSVLRALDDHAALTLTAIPPAPTLHASENHLASRITPAAVTVPRVLNDHAGSPMTTPPPVAADVQTQREAWTPLPPSVKTTQASTPTVSTEPFAQPKPSIAAQPFESTERTKSIQPLKTSEQPKVIPKENLTSAAPVRIREPIRERPRPIPIKPMPAKAAIPVLGKIVPAPPVGTTDLSSSVLESYASKMGCEIPEKSMQTKTVCGFLQEFASGLPPELPFRSDSILIGPVYTIDSNGRFTDLHYDALAGTRDPEIVSLFALPSAGGKDDFEIKQLVEARKAKTSLPTNDASARLPALIASKRMGLRKTSARSAALQPALDRRLFIRRAGDHWIVIGVSGTSAESQLNTSLAVGVLY